MQSDYLIERRKLKNSLLSWRFVALFFFLVCLYYFYSNRVNANITIPEGDFIARIKIYGPIFEDDNRLAIIRTLESKDNVKAFILQVDSPGGTFVGAESLYLSLRKLSEKRPMAAVIGGIAASGGYMVALAADHIVAYNGSITGSIGVILESFEVTELLKTLGVQPLSFKSSPLKAMPNLVEKMTPETTKAIQELVSDLHESFTQIVEERRPNIAKDQLAIICNGRGYSGRQALNYKLIDEIGDEKTALTWLQTTRQINEKLEIKDILIDNSYDDSQFSFTKNAYYGILTFVIDFIQNIKNYTTSNNINSSICSGANKALS